MKTQRSLRSLVLLVLLVIADSPRVANAAAVDAPELSLKLLPDLRILIQGTNLSSGHILQSTPSLDPPVAWQAIRPNPIVVDGKFSFVTSPSIAATFYRVHLAGLTTVASTSPSSGETGVAVSRETIFRFSQPLASGTAFSSNSLFASLGTRRLLSRAELSSDRRTVTLFYLAPLPASSQITVVLDGSLLADESGSNIDADGNGVPGSSRSVVFETLGIQPVPGTAISGRVFASDLIPGFGSAMAVNRPLEGVYISVDGAEDRLYTFTDLDGNFRLDPCPAGRFFVHVDGRDATGSNWPDGAYYPTVGKAWEAVAGRTDNLAAGSVEIFLPLIRSNTLQVVSAFIDTKITFPPEVIAANPALNGVAITVPANALFSDDGGRGGTVGIAPVAPDRLPEPLPSGLRFPLVITIQTDGASNFDRPVPVRFPNLPDAATGRKLPPGAKTALWSYNHDTGHWEIQGSMTVSQDGMFVDSDLGVGVRQPGWHGVAPGTSADGGDEREDECESANPPEECTSCTDDDDCDDGNECTKDSCTDGKCEILEPTNPCGSNTAAAENYDNWTTGFTTSPTSTTQPTDWSFDADVCYDNSVPGWRLRVTQLNSFGEVKISSAYYEPTVGAGGTITDQTDYCYAIDDLSHYYAGPMGDRTYYRPFASILAHENYHKMVELPLSVSRTWPSKELEIESLVAPCSLSAGEAESVLRAQADSIFASFVTAFTEDWNIEDLDHDFWHEGGAYLAGQEVNDVLIVELEAYAVTQNWTCLGAAPALSRAHPLAQPVPTGQWLSNLTATATATRLAVGAEAAITAQGLFRDGTRFNLPSADIPLRFISTSTKVVTVSSSGMVRGVGPGHATVLIRALPTNQTVDYRTTSIQFTVPSPADADDDKLPRSVELKYGLDDQNPSDARQDADGDGLSNLEEFLRGTNPIAADTDGDGLDDGLEIQRGANPKSRQTRRLRPVTGTQYFALFDIDNQLVQRGQADGNGVAHSQLILAPNTHYRHWLLHVATLRLAVQEYVSGDNGASFRLPAFIYRTDLSGDSDGDGLSDTAEFVVGTVANRADTDGDGINDGAEVQQGSNPLDGRLANVGIVASADTAGTALDVCVQGDRALIADGSAGVAIFNIFNPLQPMLIGQVDTPGTAQAIACWASLAAVADGSAGLAIVEVGAPANARIRHQLSFGAVASAVVIREGVAYVALGNGGVAVVDLGVGTELTRLTGLGDVDDVSVQGGNLFVLTGTELICYRDYFHGLQRRGSLAIAGQAAPLESGRKLFVCGARAYVGTFTGWHHIDLSNADLPRLLGSPTGTQAAIHDLAHDGNDLLVTIASFSGIGTLAVSSYDTSINSDTTRLLTSFDTPGACRAVALSGGLAFVSDSNQGLQVLNLRAFDRRDAAPSVRFSEALPDEDPAPGVQLSGGRVVTLSADATDDVVVRQVELWMDGRVVGIDRTCPFEFALTLPPATPGGTQVVLQLRAIDTGGNVGFATAQNIQLSAGRGAPLFVSSYPSANATVVDRVIPTLTFNEALDPEQISLSGMTLTYLGADGQLGSGDDVTTKLARLSLAVGNRVIVLTPEQPLLLPGSWRLHCEPWAIKDTGGVALDAPIAIPFVVTLPVATAEWISDTSGDWNDPTRWSNGRVPGANDHVRIERPNGNPLISLSGNARLRSLASTETLLLTSAKLTVSNAHRSKLTGPIIASNSTFTVLGPGAWMELDGLTTAAECSFVAEGGSVISLANLISFTGGALVDKAFTARGAGSRIEAPQLAQVDGPFGGTVFFFFPVLKFTAQDGGVLDFPRVGPALDGRVDIEALGSGSLIHLPTLESMEGPSRIPHGLETRGGGVILASNLTSLKWVNTLTDQPSSLSLRHLAKATNVTLAFHGGNAELPLLADVATLEIIARSNAIVTVPTLTRYPIGGGAANWLADGPGSRLEFPNLVALSGPTTSAAIPKLHITSTHGGTVNLSQVTTLTNGRVAVKAEGPGSSVNLASLVQMAGSDSTFRSSLEARDGGVLATSNMRRLERVDLVFDASSSLPTSQLTHYIGGEFQGVRVSPDLSAVIDATGAGFLALEGAVIQLPGVRSNAVSSARRWRADGVGSRIAFGNVTNVTGPTASGGVPSLDLEAVNGGVVELDGLLALTRGRFSVLADGTGSKVSLSQLARFEVSNFSSLKAQNGGRLVLSSGRVEVTRADVQITLTGEIEMGGLHLGAGALLLGTGTLKANVVNGGEIRPGTSPGILTLQGDYTQLASGKLTVEVAGVTPGGGHDQLQVTGVATLAGTLSVSPTSGYQPSVGEVFSFLTHGSHLGTFEKLTGPVLPNSLRFYLNYGIDTVTVSVAAP